ncbi:MAG: hypothetical protein CYPHOPRED_000573 [Cyphobasidiales sp. Tagirdzhanova-0007]|nr:MAG: hypothetical protein CYPHOPRED_000573 [Cyphobasidiales sp. Tagirdzhanova-0007]
METYTLPTPAYPAELGEITLALWTNIASASELRQRLVAASMMQGTEAAAVREKLDFAFIDGTMIVSRQHILTAAHQAILGAAQGELRTQTVHSELIDHLNPTTNIAEGLRRFGISAKSTSVLLVKIGRIRTDSEKHKLEMHMAHLTMGKLTSLDTLQETADMTALKKIYKMNNDEITHNLIATYTSLNKTVGVI